MPLRQMTTAPSLRRAMFMLPLGVLAAAMIYLFSLPSGEALACQPCACPVGTTVNCYGGYALFTPTNRAGDCRIDIYRLTDNRRGRRLISVSQATLDELPEFPETNTFIAGTREGDIQLYKLTTGEYQINQGPDEEGKVHVIIWRGCPAQDPYESSFTVDPPAPGDAEATTQPRPRPEATREASGSN